MLPVGRLEDLRLLQVSFRCLVMYVVLKLPQGCQRGESD
jgi:hypothetical protein